MGRTLTLGESLHLCHFSTGIGDRNSSHRPRDKEQGAILRAWMDRHVLPTFSGRILAIDTAVAQRCATLHVPNPRSDRDALIAATALVHGLTVATRNVADFERTGVGVLNPWEA